MKISNYIISGILAVAVIVLYVLLLTGKNSKSQDQAVISGDSIPGVLLPVAYVNLDTIFQKYQFAIDQNEVLLKKLENSRASVNEKERRLQQEVMEFQNKARNNAFLTTERMGQEQKRLESQQRDLDEFTTRIRTELEGEQAKFNQQMNDSIMLALKIFNNPRKYQIIFNNVGKDNILYADDAYNITESFVHLLNSRYNTASK